MGSSKRRKCYKITAYLTIKGSPKSAVAEPIHVDFANVKDAPEDFERFFKRWGLSDDVFAITPRKELTLGLRDHLRAAWRGNKAALPRMQGKEMTVTLVFTESGIEFEPAVWVQAMQLLFFQDHLAGKTAICANENCPNPYFIRKRKTQKYCEAGPCVEEAQRKHRREWWNRNRGKGAK